MNNTLRLLPEAARDIEQAFLWYEEQSRGLGMDFMRCLEAVLTSIQRTPNHYPIMFEAYRRAIVRRFPYAVFFEFDQQNNLCIIYSVFHCAQAPEKWRERDRRQIP